MAGEIPDRSEQKKAAGEPEAPATDAPDPATDDRDPRIAVARETPDPVDHATTVLRTDEGRDGDGDSDEDGDGDEGGEGGKPADAESADKADATDEADAAGEARDVEADAEADSGAEDVGTAGEAGGSAKGEDAGDDADGSAGRDEADVEADDKADDEADAGKADAVSGKSDAEAGTDGRLRDAVAAWVATDETDEADEKGKSGEGEADSVDADADEVAGEGEEEAESASEAPEEPVRGEGGPKVPAAREAGDSESEPEPEPEPESESEPDVEAEAEADADGSDDADADDAPKPAGDAADDEAAESDADGEESSATAGGESDGAGESGVKKDVGDGGVPAQGGKPDGGAEKADAGDEEAADGEDAAVVSTGVKLRKVGKREGVDQPTAVFRAPKSGPEVDQPTTMLKVGDAKAEPKDKPEAEKAGEGAAGGESEAERTSTFVPLRGLDGPAAVKPKPAGPKPVEAEEEPRAKAAVPAPAAPAAPADETAALPAAERTTQQPLPPLDLLAELTNTPPPPETPLRTAVRRVKIWTPLAILLLIVFAVVQSVRPLPEGTLALTAEETYTFQGEKPAMPWPTEGQATVTVDGIGSLGSYGEQKPIPIGSVAKVMTAYTILREHPVKKGTEGEMLTIDAKAQQDYENAGQESTVKVTEGQKISVKEAIEAIMLPSANNIARQLARWDSDGDEAAFVEKMNKYAAELGMENTTYTDPSGLKETTVSSAEDQVKLGKAVMEFETFSSVVRLPNYQSTTSGQREKNYNFLVPMYGVVGIKTGSTTKAGGNLLFAAEKVVDGKKQLIIGAVFGQHAPPILDTATARSKDLILRTQELLTSKPVVKKGDVVGHVDDGLGSTTPVVATKDIPAVGWPGLTVKLALDDGGKALPHEAKAGTKVGVLSVGDGTGDAVEVPVALQRDLAEPSFGAKLQRIG